MTRTALATAGVSAAAALPVMGGAATGEAAKAQSGACPDVKIPLKEVAGKVAVITGGASGIGLGIAKAFVGAGMKVVIADISAERIEQALAHFAAQNQADQVHGIRVNVTDRPALEQAAAETVKVFGKVHVLVNNAGVVLPPALSATSYKDWDWLMNVNLNGPFNGVQVFLPLIQAHGEGGQIITTSSVMGLFAASGGSGAYTVSKYAVVGMMEALRAELADTPIGASVFCPGMVDSNIEESSHRDRPAGATMKEEDPQTIERMKRIRKDREVTMDPLEAGQRVLRGLRNNDMYIFTHPEFEPIMRDRNEALLASIPQDLQPTEKRAAGARSAFRTSIYTIERDRRRCAQAAKR